MSARVYINSAYSRGKAKRLVDEAPAGFVMEIREPTRTDEQNRKLWPMLQDLREQVEALCEYTTEDIKLMFLNALGQELRFLPTLEKQGVFPVGMRSSTLTREQFSALLELLYEYGARNEVQWTDPMERAA